MEKRNSVLKHFDFILLDAICLAVSFLFAYLIKLNSGIQVFNRLYLSVFLWMIFVTLTYSVFLNSFKNVLRRGVADEFLDSLIHVVVNAISVFTVLYAFKVGAMYSRTQLAYTYLIYFFLSSIVKIIWKRKLIISKNENKISVFVITDTQDSSSVIYNIENSEFSEYSIKGVYLVDTNEDIKIGSYPVYNRKDNLYNAIKENSAFEVLAYCEPAHINKSTLKQILDDGIKFHISIDKVFGFEPDREEISKFSMYRTLAFNSFSFSLLQIIYNPFKRIIDIILSLLACVFLLPIYLIVKICYLIDKDTNPIIYTQTRVGRNNKEFKLLKFRSMVFNADELLKELLKDEKYRKEWEENHKFDKDPRITRIGRFIRKTSIDEFPQFVNVLKGDMSIIGPRPLVPGELKEKNGLILYEKVKPGITGWWACNGRSNISYEERLELEYYYVNNYSLLLDIVCVIKTIYVVLFRKGAK